MDLATTPRPAPSGMATRAVAWLAAALAPWIWVAEVQAQVIRIGAGSSSLYRSEGGILEVHGDRLDGWFSLGTLNPTRFGGGIRARSRFADLTLGDDASPLKLPTDVFDGGHSVATRGAGLDVRRGGTRASLAGGTTSRVYSAPYFTAGRPGDAIGILALESRLTPALTLTTHDLVFRRQTHLLGVQWEPASPFHAAVTGGTGASDGYTAASLTYSSERLNVRSAYVQAGDRFRRVLSEQAEGAEVDRENAMVTFRPTRTSALVVGHNRYMQPSGTGQPVARGSVDQILASGTVAGVAMDGAVFSSRSSLTRGIGQSFGMALDLTSRMRADLHLQHAELNRAPALTSWVGQLREQVSPRLELTQLVTRSNNNTTLSLGGSFVSNFITLGLEYQTLYLPFAARDPFQRALMLTLRLQPGASFQLNAASHVAPDGRVRYTAYGDQYLYRGQTAPPEAGSLARYMVRGRVTDETGAPVAGAALRVGSEDLVTDSHGTFFVRTRRGGRQPVKVLPDQSLSAERFDVSAAPESVLAVPEGRASEVQIVVRRASPAPPVVAPNLATPPAIDTTAIVLRLARAIHFAFNSARLSRESRAILDTLGMAMARTPSLRIALHGHSDRRGVPAYNLRLSRDRALTVRAYLLRSGIDSLRIDAAWHGMTQPVASGRDAATNARNRRVSMTFQSPAQVRVEVIDQERDLQIGRFRSGLTAGTPEP